jgi:NAD(P)-dependent dehydrogenase (short-subunit alcohol dehydrogenase family)
MRAVVVGASSGLGRSIAVGLGQRGEDVALLARRYDRLTDAAKEAGDRAHAFACDVTDPASCKEAVDAAAAALGGIDALVYTPGVGHLSRIEDVDVDTWRAAFDTNVIGASLITAAALGHVKESNGVIAYLSSVSASQSKPWPGLGAYAVSKAAMDKLVEAWSVEHPDVGFTRVIVGDCAGGEGPSMTEFPNAWDTDLAIEMGTKWVEKNLLAGNLMDVADLIDVVHTVVRLGASATVPTVIVAPRPAS